MKSILNKPITFSNQTFTIEEQQSPNSRYPFRYQPEFELILITEGEGTRTVGASIQKFKSGDLVLIGKNLKYQWESDHSSSQNKSEIDALVLKFNLDLNGTHLFNLPEHIQIRKQLNNAVRGISIEGKTRFRVAELMRELLTATEGKRILLLLTILIELSESANITMLNNNYAPSNNSNYKMNEVCAYIENNFLGNLSVTEAADLVNMHTSSFCRYFKKCYGKTFINLVSELRINYACNQLINDDLRIAEVCYSSGFNNLSNFTKIFKKITGTNPREYKNIQLNKRIVA